MSDQMGVRRWSGRRVGSLCALVVLAACSGGEGDADVIAGDATTSVAGRPEPGSVVSVTGTATTTRLTTTADGLSTTASVPVAATTHTVSTSRPTSGGSPSRTGTTGGPRPIATPPPGPAPTTTASSTPTTRAEPEPGPATTAARSPRPQTITFPSPGGGEVAFAYDKLVPLTATASSGLPVEYQVVENPHICQVVDHRAVLLTSVGPCRLEATQAGDRDYLAAAPVQASFQIVNGVSTFAFSPPGSLPLSATPATLSLTGIVGSTAFYVTATGVCGVASDVTVSGSSGSFSIDLYGPGECGVTVDQSGDQLFQIGPTETRTITILDA
jgi:hypothetical protein